MNTLLLDATIWDLTTDANGNIAMASDPYAQAQDIASACRLFLGELYYDTTKGIPYFQNILGQRPPFALLKAKLTAAALTVPGIATAQTFISAFTNRTVFGQVQASTTTGAMLAVTIPLAGEWGGFTINVDAPGYPPGLGFYRVR